MSEKKYEPVDFREFGEITESRLSPEDIAKGNKPRMYLKIKMKDEDLKRLREGMFIEVQNPSHIFERMIEKEQSGANDEIKIAQLQERIERIPKFVKKRMVAKLPKK